MTKEELKFCFKLQEQKRLLQETMQRLEEDMALISSPRLDGMPRASSANSGGPAEALAIAHADLQAKYEEKLRDLRVLQLRVEAFINTLPSREQTVMRLRYIDGLEWEEVCWRAHYSWTHTHRLHAEALKRLKKVEQEVEQDD